jgi:hypothetical protein
MNLRTRFFLSIGLLGLLCLMLSGSLRADTVYTYTGNPYTFCYGTYASSGTCAGTYALSITIDVYPWTPLDSLTLGWPGSDITGYVYSFSFTDGTGLFITQENATAEWFDIGTDVNGNITTWYIGAWNRPPSGTGVWQYFQSGTIGCGSRPCEFDATNIFGVPGNYNDGGYRWNSPGTWAMETVPIPHVPEPSTYVLLCTGLLGLLALAARSKRHAHRA